MGISFSLGLTDTGDGEGILQPQPRFAVGGWRRQTSGCLVGDESQREVLPLGDSSHKYQRYALIFLFISQTLRRRKKTISWAITCARHGVG